MPDRPLSPQQRRVLELLCAGRDRAAIAAELALAPASLPRLIHALLRAHGATSERVLVARVLGERLARCQESLAAIEERTGVDRRG